MQPVTYKYTSTKEYIDAFPVAYRQWRADSSCNLLHGYALSIKLFFGTNELDARNWAMDFGGLKPLKEHLTDWFDHRLLVAQDDPEYDLLVSLYNKGLAKITVVEKTGCEGIADYLYRYINGIFLPTYGSSEAKRLWCYRVSVRETQSNEAHRIGHREWGEDLLE